MASRYNNYPFMNSLIITTLFTLIITDGLSLALGRPIVPDDELMKRKHEEWMALHGRVYKDVAEKEARYNIFKENLRHIDAFNNNNNGSGFTLGVNKFADLTNKEFRETYTQYRRKPPSVLSNSEAKSFRYRNFTAIPKSLDWRARKAVSSVKNQGSCGCCWAFSAVAATEGIIMLKKGKLRSLSVQELVDCDKTLNHGCHGGLMDHAFQYIKRNGLTSEANYRYKEAGGKCNARKAAKKAAMIAGYEDVPKKSEKALLQAVANQPVSIAIEGGGFMFRFYSGGVFTGSCGTDVDHAVTVVGFGRSSARKKYWILKNSWGTGWGEKGYMRIQRDVRSKAGLCGLAIEPSYPTL
ncbi:hypothetical protein SAY87_022286 [Trapa incisa]|uniref:Uncharacterized protein n=2 Tax=Trapa TaxID=22665 RepID=A0AAN7R1B2_TRANT|nr:hypothetical protein SAY87_022286 [Trapa incisa]KAK4783691.1 hypothetical protein SAY86_008065 [Trapa natans]